MSAPAVCMVVHNAFRHDARVLREATALAAAGYDVRVVAAADDRGAGEGREQGIRVLRVASDPLPARLWRRGLARRGREARIGAVATPPERLGGGPRAALARLALRVHLALEQLRFLRLAAAAARSEPAAVHVAHDLDALPAVWWAARRSGGRVVYDSHELFCERVAVGRATRPLWRALERALIRRADLVVTVSESIAAELAGRYGVRQPLVIRNLPATAPGPRRSSPLRGALGIDAGARVVLYLGGLQPGRGLETLVEATALMDDVQVVLMGPARPDYARTLTQLAQRLGVKERIVLAAPVASAEVVRWAAGADVGIALTENVSLNNYLSLPNKLFEYVAAGLPVVASAFPELERVVGGRGLGVTCSPGEPAEIARAVGAVLADPDRLERFRAASRAASAELTWEREAPKLLDAVAELARGR